MPTSPTEPNPKSALLYDPVQIKKDAEAHPSVASYLRYLAAIDRELSEADTVRRLALRDAKRAERKIFRLMDKRGKQRGALSVVRQYIYNQLVSQAIKVSRDRILNANQ